MNDDEDFEIKDGVLVKYHGEDEDVVVPAGVTEIWDYAFEDCINLKTIELPDTLSNISDGIFYEYEGTVIVNLSKYNPYKFDYEARKRCLSYNASSLLKDNIEEEKLNVWINYFRGNGDLYYDEIIENKALLQFVLKYKCLLLEDVKELLNRSSEENLTEVTAMLLEYEHNTFTEEDLMKFKESELSVEDAYWKNLRIIQYQGEDFLTVVRYKGEKTDIEIPQCINGLKVTRIGEYAFSPEQRDLTDDEKEARKNINSITVPDSITEICRSAFKGCVYITNIELQNKECKLDAETFDEISHELKKLQSFNIPEGITVIGDSAFANYEELTSVTIPSTVTEIGSCVFYNCKKLGNITVSKDNKNYYMSDGILYNKDGIAVCYPENKKEDSEFDTSVLTETPVVLEKSTDGTYGSEGIYVLFGDWPQTIKSDDVIIDEKHRYNINGWESYRGSDGCYYVKATAKPDKKDYTFSNGVKIRNGYVYYFKLESIKWRILDDNYGGGKLLLSEQALTSGCYYPDYDDRTIDGSIVYPNNYEYSRIRAYLNGLDGSSYDVEDYRDRGFINKAFSEKAIAKINTVTVDNWKESTTDSGNNLGTADDYVCKNTQDKLFLLSEREVTKESYGFDKYDRYIGDDEGTKTSTRIRKATDYSKASGVWYDTDEGLENNSLLWLRSPNDDFSYLARGVGSSGYADYYYGVRHTHVGVVPALSISF